MPYVFNPFTGTLDYFKSASMVSDKDFHSGFYNIPSSDSVTIEENKQSVTFGLLTLDGELLIEGEVIVEM